MRRLSIGEVESIFGVKCKNQVTTVMPVVGSFTCHSMLEPQFRGMFQSIEGANLIHLIKNDGCYNCRRARKSGGDYSSTPSRHSWGIAWDNNAAAYPYPSNKQQPQELLDIYAKWGFYVPVKTDPMHIEFIKFVDNPIQEEEENEMNQTIIESKKIHNSRYIVEIPWVDGKTYKEHLVITMQEPYDTKEQVAGVNFEGTQIKILNLFPKKSTIYRVTNYGGKVTVESKVPVIVSVRTEKK